MEVLSASDLVALTPDDLARLKSLAIALAGMFAGMHALAWGVAQRDKRDQQRSAELSQTPELGCITLPNGLRVWRLEQHPLHGHVDAVAGSAVNFAALVGIPYARLALSVPEHMFGGAPPRHCTGRAGGISATAVKQNQSTLMRATTFGLAAKAPRSALYDASQLPPRSSSASGTSGSASASGSSSTRPSTPSQPSKRRLKSKLSRAATTAARPPVVVLHSSPSGATVMPDAVVVLEEELPSGSSRSRSDSSAVASGVSPAEPAAVAGPSEVPAAALEGVPADEAAAAAAVEAADVAPPAAEPSSTSDLTTLVEDVRPPPEESEGPAVVRAPPVAAEEPTKRVE